MTNKKGMIIFILTFICAISVVLIGFGSVDANNSESTGFETFTVGEGSSVKYGEHPYAPGVKGVVASLQSGDSLLYNKVVDLSDNTYDDTLISLFITPAVIGNYDFSSLNIKITDAFDKNNYVVINAYRYYYENYACYLKAAAPGAGQELTGVDPGLGDIWVGGVFGQYNLFSFSGTPQPDKAQTIGDDTLDIRFDYENKIVYAMRYNDPFWSFVVDLDDEKYFDHKWEGFTTGEVFISVYAEEYSGSSAGIVIREIDGHDLSVSSVTDETPPLIEIDYEGYEVLPVALVGNRYPVFKATAYDVYCGETEVSYKVLYEGKEIELEEDGTFIPTKEGDYTIHYTSIDRYNNKAEKQVTVKAALTTPEILLELDKSEADESGYVGELVRVASFTASGGSGKVNVMVEACLKDGTTKYLVQDNLFKPYEKGTYEILYTAKDYTGKTVTQKYEIDIELKKDPIFDSEIQLPICFLSGKVYELPSLYALDYYTENGEPVEVKAEISYIDDYGLFTAKDNIIIPMKKQNGNVTILYTAATPNGSATKKYEVPVQVTENSWGGLNLKNYFLMQNVKSVAESDNILFSTSSEDASVCFAREVLAKNFKIQFKVDPAQANFSEVNVVLTDYEQRDVQVKFTVHKDLNNSSISYLSVNGGKKYNTVGAFDGSSLYPFSISYDAKSNTITDGISTVIAIEKTLSGKEFTGFPSGKVYIEINFGGVIGLSAIKLSNLCSQVFGNFTIDTIAPNVVIEDDYGGMYAKGTVVTLPKAYAMDILDPNPSVTMTVTSPSGKTVFSTDGYYLENIVPKREFEILLAEYGRYLVTFSAEDAGGQKNINTRYMIYCSDNLSPEISLDSEMPKTGKVGEEIILPHVSVSDNYTQTPLVHISYVDPLGRVLSADDYKIVPTAEGIYKVTYSVTDEQGNSVFKVYEIQVESCK